jgi:quaternary ammonium compound-resistance protein SugE
MRLGPWALLVVAGLLEVTWAVGVRYTQGWTRPLISALVVVCYAGTLYPLSLALRTIPAGTAYAVWVGIGTIGVAAWGIAFWEESASLYRIASIALILLGVVGLKFAP